MTPSSEFLVSGMGVVVVSCLGLIPFWFIPRFRETARAFSFIPLLLFLLAFAGFSVRLVGERFNVYAVERGFEPITDWSDFLGFLFHHYFGSV